MKKGLKVKDLVTIGIFSIIYFVSMFAVGMIGLIPILFLIWPFINGVVLGPIVMLFMAKEKKPWALFIFGMLTPTFMFVAGHSYVLVVNGLIVMLIAEFIRRGGDYKSFKYNALANGFFSMWASGSLLQMLVVKEKYIEMTTKQMGTEYAAALERLITGQSMVIIYISAFIGGLIGAYVGKILLKKHFEKAGIV